MTDDMSGVIEPKAEELTADHLLSGPRTITITGVTINPGTERPVTIAFEDDEGHPLKPCKSVSRVFVAAWGADAKKYVGRRATLFRDPTVKWGGMAVGGIRVSHLSHIEREMQLALTATKGKKAITVVKPLADAPKPTKAPVDVLTWSQTVLDSLNRAPDATALTAFWNKRADELKDREPARYELVSARVQARVDELTNKEVGEG